MTINDRIEQAAMEFRSQAACEPQYLYLGREEVRALGAWAYQNDYIGTPEFRKGDLEGEHRPEINGLYLMAVNADKHLKVTM